MTSTPKEHDYIGLSGIASSEKVSDKLSSSSSSASSSTTEDNNSNKSKASTCLNLKETELRLGLPGSHSPEPKLQSLPSGVSLFGKDIDTSNNNNLVHDGNGYSCNLSGSSKNLVSGAKRVFSDAIDESSENWVFSVNNGSDVDMSNKGAVLFSPKGGNGNNNAAHNAQKPTGLVKNDVIAGGGIIAQSPKAVSEKNSQVSCAADSAPASNSCKRAQVVGWPPLRSFRKSTMASNVAKNNEDAEGNSGSSCLYVKVSMDGAPYLRKVDLKTYSNYTDLSSGLEKMFRCFTIGQCSSQGLAGRGGLNEQCSSQGLAGRGGLNETCLKDILHRSEYVLTYEDKDADWMLVGDVPWEMFTDTCRRLRITTGSEAIGLAPRTVEKCKSHN